MSRPYGPLYEALYTQRLRVALEGAADPELRPLDGHEAPGLLARHVAQELVRVLQGLQGNPAQQADVANQVLEFLRSGAAHPVPEDVAVVIPPQELLSADRTQTPPRTVLPFSSSALLTRGRHEPNLAHELAREIATADRIDAIVSFVTMGGVRTLVDALEGYAASGRPLRLLTTTYMGATEAVALDRLARLPGVEVRVSFDARRSRLHAKAWLFRRDSGLDTAYVGSANWSRAALTEGQEWMIKASSGDLPDVIKKFVGTFDTLWSDPEFEAYHPDHPEQRARLVAALSAEAGGADGDGALTFFTLAPYPFQQAILDRLAAEREVHGRTRNLVVAATGTGKTMIAAFDYARRVGADRQLPRLLVLAHRKELLEQARTTFRQVLREGSFGEVLAEGRDPVDLDHLFATIQSFGRRSFIERLGASYWDHVIVDECHHAPADSYRMVMEQLRPRILVGLTATPERQDGRSLLDDFDGHVAAELRLWEALERRLLVPFEYHGLHDSVDLRDVAFTRGRYAVDGLDRVFTGDTTRAALVLAQLQKRVASVRDIRAIGFCVSVAHADFMAATFNRWGVPSMSLHGDSSDEERRRARAHLASREVNIIFTCDLYNEGVDLPFVDTLLLLRPTESATLFLQQLGRGLRLSDDKSSCLVLDFIGLHRQEFRFEIPLMALTGLPRGVLREAVAQQFPLLPSGCQLVLDRVSQQQVLDNLRRSLQGGLRRLVDELKAVASRAPGAPVSLAQFLKESGRDVGEVFTKDRSWSTLCRAVGWPVPPGGADEADLAGRLRMLLHLDDPERLRFYRDWLRGAPQAHVHGDAWAQMLAYAMFEQPNRFMTGAQLKELFEAHPAVRDDAESLFDVLLDRVGRTTPAVPGLWPWPLALHRTYLRREILTAVGHWHPHAKPSSREGVLRIKDQKLELLFVTLNKSDRHFTPTTSYDDYAVDATHFHWQSQSQTNAEGEAGRRYVEQATNGWQFVLCVRATTGDPFTVLGPVRYVRHEGSRPMSILWKLDVPMPGDCLREYLQFAS